MGGTEDAESTAQGLAMLTYHAHTGCSAQHSWSILAVGKAENVEPPPGLTAGNRNKQIFISLIRFSRLDERKVLRNQSEV